MNNKKSSNFGVGLLIGSVLGGIAALFLSPKSGKENREIVSQKIHDLKIMVEEKKVQQKVEEIYGEATEEGTKLYTMARDEMNTRLDELKKTMDEIDMARYKEIVNDVMDRVKKDSKDSGERVTTLKQYFLDKWGEAKHEAKEDKEIVANKVKKEDSKVN